MNFLRSTLFALWAALSLPWVLAGRHAALWLTWALLLNVTLTLWLGLGRAAKPGWKVQDMNPFGACGEAHLATAEKGEATLDFAVDRLVELLGEIERFPLTSLNTRPAW